MHIGEIIADLRKKNNMTQDALGKSLHVSAQAVSKWENGKSSPDIETISKIANLFNVDVLIFFKNELNSNDQLVIDNNVETNNMEFKEDVITNDIEFKEDIKKEFIFDEKLNDDIELYINNVKPKLFTILTTSFIWGAISVYICNNIFTYENITMFYKVFELTLIFLIVFSLIFHYSYNSLLKRILLKMKIYKRKRIKLSDELISTLFNIIYVPFVNVIYFTIATLLKLSSFIFIPYSIITFNRREEYDRK